MSTVSQQEQLESALRYHQSGDVVTAAQIYARILQQDPEHADAWHLSGLVAFHQQSFAEAELLIRRALELRPRQPEYLSNLAAVLLAANRPREAEHTARAAGASGGTAIKWQKHLASALARQGRESEAVPILEDVIRTSPQDASAHSNLGALLLEMKRPEGAVRILHTAVELNSRSFEARLNLGGALREIGQLQQALAQLNTAVELSPQSAQCYVNRGNTYLDLGNTEAALADFHRAVELNPQSALALNGLARTLQTMNEFSAALDAFDLACQLAGPLSRFESNRLYCASLTPHLGRDQLFDLHASWGRLLEQATPVLPTVRYNHSRIRIGYVSPDFRHHATMRFFLPLLESHDRDQFQIYCYGECRLDEVSDRIRSGCSGWRNTQGIPDADVIRQIRQDEIDVLIDLAGHTAGNRLPVFAAAPAPLQASFLGYPNTTGLSRIDLFLTDAIRESASTEQFYTEQPIYLPHGACCFEAPADYPVADPPVLQNGTVTFGSTHRLEKLSHNCLQLWGRILNSVPSSKLLVARDSLAHESTRTLVGRQLNAAGINLSQVEFCGEIPDNHLELYQQIDIVLDVFPWGSGTTAYECMWMGVPIPTIAGDRGACRATASLMHQLEMPDLTAASGDDYVGLTAALANDIPRLTHLRRIIRPRMQATVCNGRQFAADIESVCLEQLQQKTLMHAAATQEALV